MSGICGIVHFDGAPVDPEVLCQMAQAAAHRGVDGIRYWLDHTVGLAHLVHNITPESQREQQPLVSQQQDVALSADARLDNRDDLLRLLTSRGHLTASPTPTDAQVILAAYRCWGPACAAHLLGDFAFVVWDAVHRRLFAARDAMAMRAFYYRVEPRRLLFATEVKQLLVVPDVPVRLFEPAVGAHLAGPYGLLEWTFYDGIAQLPPAHALLVDAAGHRTWRYWDIDPDFQIRYAHEAEYVEHFLEIFQEAVRCRLRSVKPVGISLSGGMDSGSIAATAGWLRTHGAACAPPPLQAYCWDFTELPQCGERHISDGLVHHYGLSVTYIPADTAWPLKDYPAHGPDRDDPFIWVYQTLIEHTLAAAQAEGMGLLLVGDRGDEMVGDWVFDHPGLLRSRQWRLLWDELQAHSQWLGASMSTTVQRHLLRPLLLSWWPEGKAEGLRRYLRQLRSSATLSYPAWIRPEFANRIELAEIIRQSAPQPNVNGAARRLRYERIFMFPGVRIATAGERSQARFGLGFADPWSDRRLASFVLAVPQWVIQRVQEPKRIARQAMRGIMPETVRQAACKSEPVALFERGFMCRAKDTVLDFITNSQAAARGYVDATALDQYYASFLRGEPQDDDFWWPLTLEMWLRQYWS
jgi:asparagine synthase (glutamine-hydrolysing)